MNVKQYGFYVNPVDFNYVSNELEMRNINYDIWNAEEVFFGTAERVEFNVATEEDAEILREILSSIPEKATNS